ncbi:hypothetical protein HDU97_008867 [Phlyctochytrium planicorne]|nr:hypothetical protein HDU97_008867 [Phlyctochytrium planicorne]
MNNKGKDSSSLGLPLSTVRLLFTRIALSVDYCHQRGIFHRDLKPENILIHPKDLSVRLADFGLATDKPWSFIQACGSVRYMSPECLGVDLSRRLPPPNPPKLKGFSSPPNDVWALGIILLNMLFAQHPWSSPADETCVEAYFSDVYSSPSYNPPHCLLTPRPFVSKRSYPEPTSHRGGHSRNRSLDLTLSGAEDVRARFKGKGRKGGHDVFLQELGELGEALEEELGYDDMDVSCTSFAAPQVPMLYPPSILVGMFSISNDFDAVLRWCFHPDATKRPSIPILLEWVGRIEDFSARKEPREPKEPAPIITTNAITGAVPTTTTTTSSTDPIMVPSTSANASLSEKKTEQQQVVAVPQQLSGSKSRKQSNGGLLSRIFLNRGDPQRKNSVSSGSNALSANGVNNINTTSSPSSPITTLSPEQYHAAASSNASSPNLKPESPSDSPRTISIPSPSLSINGPGPVHASPTPSSTSTTSTLNPPSPTVVSSPRLLAKHKRNNSTGFPQRRPSARNFQPPAPAPQFADVAMEASILPPPASTGFRTRGKSLDLSMDAFMEYGFSRHPKVPAVPNGKQHHPKQGSQPQQQQQQATVKPAGLVKSKSTASEKRRFFGGGGSSKNMDEPKSSMDAPGSTGNSTQPGSNMNSMLAKDVDMLKSGMVVFPTMSFGILA